MHQSQPSPKKPGWYLDPAEAEHNYALRDQWRRQGMYLGQDKYRLRRWDGQAWTEDTLQDYYMLSGLRLPHSAGPTTRMYPITYARKRRDVTRWAILMVLCGVGALVYEVLK